MGKIKVYTGVLAFLAIFLMGAGTSDDKFNIGTGSTTTNKELRLGTNHVLRSDITGGNKLQFSNNAGADWKDIGSGAGAGSDINILSGFNGDCETGNPTPSDWVSTGGTFTAETGSPANGGQSCSWDPSATTEYVRSALASHPARLEDGTCTTRIYTKWPTGVDGEIVWYVEDSGSTKLTTSKNVIVSAGWEPDILVYTCPAPGTTTRVVFESTANAGVLLYDDVTLGRSGVIQSDSVDTDWEDFTPTGSWVTNTTYTGKWRRDGTDIIMLIQLDLSGAPNATNLTIDDHPDHAYDSGSFNVFRWPIKCEFVNAGVREYTCSGYKGGGNVFQIVHTELAGAGNVDQANPFTWGTSDTITLEIRYPVAGWKASTYSEAITLETTGWHVDANIGGANPSLSTSSVATYSSVVDAGLDIVTNTSKGSSPVEIPCSAGNESSGSTCSAGSEVLGASFTIPTTGRYKMCMYFSHRSAISVSSTSASIFKMSEYENNLSAELQSGETRLESHNQWDLGTNTLTQNKAITLCDNFVFSTVGKKTIILLYEHLAAGTVAGSILLADRDALVGQRDIHITIEKMDQQFPTPVFTELQNSLAKKPEYGTDRKMCSFRLSMTGTTVSLDSGCVQSASNNGTGDDSITFTPGFWTSIDFCTCNGELSSGDTSGYTCHQELTLSTTTARFIGKQNQTGGPTIAFDVLSDIVCYGQ